MFHKFEEEIGILTERSKTMSIEEFLLDEAEKKGVEKNTLDIAIKMKKAGADIKFIADITGLSIEEISRL